MILLRYYIHVLGDIHQPLHVGHDRDRGGNLCDARWKDLETGHVRVANLHAAWDNSLITDMGEEFHKKHGPSISDKRLWFGYRELVIEQLGARIDYETAQKAGILNWYEESRAYYGDGYPDSSPGQDPEDRVY